MNTFKKIMILSMVLLSLTGSVPQVVLAASHLVSPLAIDLNLEKRDITTQYITVTNTTDAVLRLYASVNTVATDGNGIVKDFIQPVAADRTNTPTAWIEISRKRMELSPYEKKEIPFKVQMNPNTIPGEYNVLISFANASNRQKAEQKVRDGDAPGTIVHITVDKKQNQFLRLKHFLVNKFISGDDEDTLSFTLSNPGSSDVIPSGEIIFYDNNGSEVAAVPINSQKQVVVADSETDFVMNVPDELSIGKYKAFLSVEYGEHLTASVHDTAFFYVLPWKLLLMVFMIVLVSAILVALYIHRRYDTIEENDGAGPVAMYIKKGVSKTQHHDIDLSKQNK